jgi:mannan endo-1,6-alpha-mannosidase
MKQNLILLFIGSVLGATVDVNDPQAIAKAHQSAAANLMSYYKPNDKGTIPPKESEGRDGFQWFEMGMLWGAMNEFTNLTKDDRYFQTIGKALENAGNGNHHSFIGPKVNGKWKTAGFWNDDIGWWSFGAISASEINGANAVMSNGVSYLTLAKTTWEQMNEQVSNQGSTCSGGVFWYRDRNSNQPNRARLLSTISSLQYAFLSARLYFVTGEKSYLDAAIRTYSWLFNAKLVTAQGQVFDGTYSPRCWQIEAKEHSYNSGLFLGVSGLLYKATGDDKYMKNAKTVLNRAQTIFADKNGIIIDECEPSKSCKVNQAAFKGIFLRGLAYLYSSTKEESIRSPIKGMITSSLNGMVKTCSDSWACNNIWTPDAKVYSDVHTQNTALELFNTYSVILGKSTTVAPEPPKNSTNNGTTVNEDDCYEEIEISDSLRIAPLFFVALSVSFLLF